MEAGSRPRREPKPRSDNGMSCGVGGEDAAPWFTRALPATLPPFQSCAVPSQFQEMLDARNRKLMDLTQRLMKSEREVLQLRVDIQKRVILGGEGLIEGACRDGCMLPGHLRWAAWESKPCWALPKGSPRAPRAGLAHATTYSRVTPRRRCSGSSPRRAPGRGPRGRTLRRGHDQVRGSRVGIWQHPAAPMLPQESPSIAVAMRESCANTHMPMLVVPDGCRGGCCKPNRCCLPRRQ